MAVSRRDFLGFTAATAAGLTLGEWGRRAIASLENLSPRFGDGVERWRTAVCGQCPAACGIRVRLVDGWPVKIEGNPLCPLARGKTCPKGQAGLLALYDPDRLRGPVRRDGERGKGKFRPISWDDAVGELTTRLQKTRPQAVGFLAPVDPGPRGEILRRFCRAYGTPRPVETETLRDRAAADCLSMTLGIHRLPAYDLERTRYLLSLGTPLLEGWSSPTWLHRAYGHFRRGRASVRGWFVQAEARLSPTAAKADEWVPLRPGTEADLALGLAHVLIRESRFDAAYVSSHCSGFDEGLREWILERYDPDFVSARTGVPVVEIIRLAREFSATGPSLALCEGYPFSKGLAASWAALVLNALVGSLDASGGVLLPETLPLPLLFPPDRRPATEGDSTSSGDPPDAFEGEPLDVLVLTGCAAGAGLPADSIRDARFVVSFSSFLDETTEAADLVLPESTFLESWHGAVPEPALPSPLIALARPAAATLLDTRDFSDVLLDLAQRLGGSVAEALAWQSFPQFLKELARGLFAARRGSPFSTPFEADWLRQLEHAGLWTRTYGDFEDFWEKCLEAGGWWDPGLEIGQALRSLKTASGKIELFPASIRRLLAGREEPLRILHRPVVEAVGEDPFPLDLFLFEILPLAGLPDRNQASLYEILGQHLQKSWEPWVELNSSTASELGLRDQEFVWVESPHGRIRARAVVYEGAMPGAAFIPLSVLQRAGGRWVPKSHEVAFQLLAPSHDPGSGLPTGLGTRVRVTRA